MSKNEIENIAVDPVLAIITMDEDGNFFVENTTGDKAGVQSGPLKFCDEGDKTIVLTENDANRWWANRAKVTAACKADGQYGLTYKESKKFGPIGTKLPNEKLISYLSEEEQAEYKAIIDRAKAARDEAKAKPLTELEKAQAAAKRANEKYERLLKAAAATPAND